MIQSARLTSLPAALALAMCLGSGCSDSTTGVTQSPITFTLDNDTSAPLYIGWQGSRPVGFTFERYSDAGDRWEDVSWSKPVCLARCSDDNEGKECALACGPMFLGIRRISAAKSVALVWDGRRYPITRGHCSEAACYSDHDPEAGKYRMTVCAFDSYSCIQGDPNCATPVDTTSSAGLTDGNKKCASKELTVPFAGDSIALPIK